jgi:hypothetical protein
VAFHLTIINRGEVAAGGDADLPASLFEQVYGGFFKAAFRDTES